MMNVMHITYDMRIGGTEMVIKNIIEGNSDNDINMSIFCIEASLGPWGEELKAKDIPVFIHERKPGFDLSLIRAIRHRIKTQSIDVIHCHQYTPWVYGALASVLTKANVIFTEHGRFYPDSSSWKRRFVNPVLVGLTSCITAISAATKQALVDYEYLSEKHISVVYNGIEPLSVSQSDVEALRENLGIKTSTTVLGTIARFDPIKNQTMMIRAFHKVLQSHPDTVLVMVGDGEMRKTLEGLINELGISDNVMFTGYIAKPAMYLAMMDIFLLSSLSEGTSMTLLEAMSLGKPCVVTDAGGNAEVIEDGKNGIVCENDNTDDFAKSVSGILSDTVNLHRMGLTSKNNFFGRFHHKKMNEQYTRFYFKLGQHEKN
tara:strand:+ start:4145 stop:5263 length:1119 start_codon:yes stop_codon:yes gene_type:complete